MSRISSVGRSCLTLATAFAATALLAPAAQAQEPLPAVLPEVLFLVEESDAMNSAWAGDPTLTTPSTRWEYARDAIKQVVQNAPLDMTFGVALTANGGGNEPDRFEQLAYPGTATATMVTALDSYTFTGGSEVTWGESYEDLLDEWADHAYASPRSWSTGPFQYYCNSLIVIVIGFSTGEGDGNVSASFRQTPTADVLCNDNSLPLPQQGCWLDDVAAFAQNGFSPPPLTSSGAVFTHTILLDSAVATVDAANLFNSAASDGGGITFAPTQPGAIASSIWGALTDSFSGSYSNAAISMSPNGDLMLASYFDVQAGFPLYKGHLLAWNIDNDPTSANFGEILPGTGPFNTIWDGGQLLASRTATGSETNQGTFSQQDRRNGYTAKAAMAMFSDPLPFDSSSLGAGTDLTTLLIDEVSAASNPTCATLPHDFDFDCDADFDDAQIMVDFLRGVATSNFIHTGTPRGPWKMGDTGRATAVVAPSEINAIALEQHFRNYRFKLGQLPSVAYITSNAGQVHAFNIDAGSVTQGSELWFYMPRAKLDKAPDTGSKEFDGFQADDLMRSGQTFVNDGRLTIDHVWLDGYLNDLSGCSGPGYVAANDDGVVDSEGCEWHRVLTWSGGNGSRHTYSLDVTNPTRAAGPIFLWERTDSNSTTYTGAGRSVGRPLVASFWDSSGSAPERRWVAVWGAGAQPPGGIPGSGLGHASVYVHDMDTVASRRPTNYPVSGFKINHPSGTVTDTDSDTFDEYPSTELGLFGAPSGADIDGDGSLDVVYIGDSMGYVFKVALNPATPSSATTCLFSAPNTGDVAKHVYYEPAIFFDANGNLLVYYGSGSPWNIYEPDAGGIYAKADPDPFNCTNPSGTSAQGVAAPCASSSSLFDNTGFYALGQGGAIGEKLVGKPTVRFGRMFFATHIPGSDVCVLGNSRLYGMNVETCAGGLFDDTTDSYSVTSDLYTEVPGLISEPVFANGQLYALNIDAGGLDSASPIDDFSVTPNNYFDYVYIAHRHIF